MEIVNIDKTIFVYEHKSTGEIKCHFYGETLEVFEPIDYKHIATIDPAKYIENRYRKTLNEYQEQAEQFAIYPENHQIIYPTLGLTGEAGEVADKIKKIMRDNGGIYTSENRLEIAKELGDVLWYVAILGRDIGYSLEEIADLNIEKLTSRKERNKLSGSGDNR